MYPAAVRPGRAATRSYAYWQVTGAGHISDMPAGKKKWVLASPTSAIANQAKVVT
jgi:hypothetical protein